MATCRFARLPAWLVISPCGKFGIALLEGNSGTEQWREREEGSAIQTISPPLCKLDWKTNNRRRWTTRRRINWSIGQETPLTRRDETLTPTRWIERSRFKPDFYRCTGRTLLPCYCATNGKMERADKIYTPRLFTPIVPRERIKARGREGKGGRAHTWVFVRMAPIYLRNVESYKIAVTQADRSLKY